MTSYKDDPRSITAKFESTCSKCGVKISKGDVIYYWPKGKKVMCAACGEPEYRQFLSMAADEDVYNGCGNPYCY